MGRYNHSLALDATIGVLKTSPPIGEHVAIAFVTNFRNLRWFGTPPIATEFF